MRQDIVYIPRKIYLWLYCLTTFLFLLSGFCIFTWYKVFISNSKVEITSDGNYLTVLIGLAGFLAAFSAISIYSVFNAHVDREKERIDKITIEAKANLEKIEDLLDYIKNNELNFYKMKVLTDLTSSFSTINKKREAIQFFTQQPPETKDTKMFIRNYFKSIDANQNGEKYYRELEKLLTDWRMISLDDKPEEIQPV